MVGTKLGDLLREMAQLQGLNRVLALALNSEVVASSLEHGAKEGNTISFEIGPRMTAEEIVVVQCLFFRWCDIFPGGTTIGGEQYVVAHNGAQSTDRPAGVCIHHMDVGNREFLPGSEVLDRIDR